MDKILNKIIKQVIVEATTVKRLTKQVNSDTILNKLIKQVITEAAQKVVLSKLDNKVGAIVSKYCFGFKISANFPIDPDQVRTQIQGNSQFGTKSPYNSYLNYTYFVGSNMHKNPDKKFVANVIIVDAVTMNSFNSAKFKNSVKYLLEPGDADVVAAGYKTNTVGRKDADLEAQHHKNRGTEAVYNSTSPEDKYNVGSDLIFIDTEPGYANLPADLMTVLTKKGAALMSTDDDDVTANDTKKDAAKISAVDKASAANLTTDEEPTLSIKTSDSENLDVKDDESLDTKLSIKKQTFKYGIRDNADLKQLQDEIKAKLKAGPDQSYINSVPALKAFMNTANMTGYYGTITSNMIADLKKAYAYKNTDGKTIESDFIELLIGKMNSKLKLTEQFNFTDTEKKLISNKTVLDPVKVDTRKDDTKTVKLKNLDQIPLGSNNWRSAQPTATQLAKFIIEKGIKSVIRFNGDGTDTDNNFSIDNEKAISTQNGAKFYKLSSTKDQETVNSLLNSGNVLVHCHHGADRTGGNIGGWLYSKGWGDTKKIWDYTTKYNGWNRMAINSPSAFSKGGYLYQATKFGVKDINHAQELANGNKSIKKDATKKDDIKTGDTEKVALTKAYQLCLDAAKDLRKITTTNPQQYWKQYLRWNGLSYRSNANEKGIAWFKSAWDKAWGTKLAAASKIRNTATQKNINELNRRKNDIIEMIRKGGSMTVYLRIQNPFNGTPTDFKIKWDYLSGIQNAAFKGNPKKTVTNKQAQDFYNKKGKYRKPIKNPGFAD